MKRIWTVKIEDAFLHCIIDALDQYAQAKVTDGYLAQAQAATDVGTQLMDQQQQLDDWTGVPDDL